MRQAVKSKTKERPILFSGPMVRAILRGHKTVTRRVVTEKQKNKCSGLDYMKTELLTRSPYGKPGDVLWVRETWYPDDWKFWCRAACRLKLLITDVRVERLQDISEQQALAEGIIQIQDGPEETYVKALTAKNETRYPTAKDAFRSLWDDINKKRGYGWDANPLLWVVEFEKLGGKSYE